MYIQRIMGRYGKEGHSEVSWGWEVTNTRIWNVGCSARHRTILGWRRVLSSHRLLLCPLQKSDIMCIWITCDDIVLPYIHDVMYICIIVALYMQFDNRTVWIWTCACRHNLTLLLVTIYDHFSRALLIRTRTLFNDAILVKNQPLWPWMMCRMFSFSLTLFKSYLKWNVHSDLRLLNQCCVQYTLPNTFKAWWVTGDSNGNY